MSVTRDYFANAVTTADTERRDAVADCFESPRPSLPKHKQWNLGKGKEADKTRLRESARQEPPQVQWMQ